MKDSRLPFKKAKKELRAFLKAIGFAKEIVWITRDQVLGHRDKVWIYQNGDSKAEEATERFYEGLREQPSASIRLDALCQYEGVSLCYVEKVNDESAHLNFGAYWLPLEVESIDTRSSWIARQVLLATRRDRHPIMHREITPASVSA